MTWMRPGVGTARGAARQEVHCEFGGRGIRVVRLHQDAVIGSFRLALTTVLSEVKPSEIVPCGAARRLERVVTQVLSIHNTIPGTKLRTLYPTAFAYGHILAFGRYGDPFASII